MRVKVGTLKVIRNTEVGLTVKETIDLVEEIEKVREMCDSNREYLDKFPRLHALAIRIC